VREAGWSRAGELGVVMGSRLGLGWGWGCRLGLWLGLGLVGEEGIPWGGGVAQVTHLTAPASFSSHSPP